MIMPQEMAIHKRQEGFRQLTRSSTRDIIAAFHSWYVHSLSRESATSRLPVGSEAVRRGTCIIRSTIARRVTVMSTELQRQLSSLQCSDRAGGNSDNVATQKIRGRSLDLRPAALDQPGDEFRNERDVHFHRLGG